MTTTTTTTTTKKFGFYSIVLLTINSIIGSGIFLSPGSVVNKSGALAPLVYFCAAFFAAVLAITFAAAAKYVKAGGAAYAYSKAAFGENTGLYIGITRYFSAAIAWGVMATGVVRTVFSIFGLPKNDLKLLTLGFFSLMAVLFIINVMGPAVLEFVSNLSTLAKLAALIVCIVAGALLVLFGGQNNFTAVYQLEIAQKGSLSASEFVMATVAAFYAFTGFESVASGSEDMEKPEKNLPRAIPLGILIVAIIYIAIVVVGMMLDPVKLATTKEVIALIPLFDNPIIKNIILYGALISMFGINVAASFHTPRILEAMAKQGQVPALFTKRTNRGFPVTSTIITVVIAILIPFSFSYNMGSIMIISAIVRFAQFIVVPLALIAFYYGKCREKVEPACKNFVTDVAAPFVSLLLTVLLLVKFNWVGQFTVEVAGARVPNTLAIAAMIVGMIVSPAALYLYNRQRQAKR